MSRTFRHTPYRVVAASRAESGWRYGDLKYFCHPMKPYFKRQVSQRNRTIVRDILNTVQNGTRDWDDISTAEFEDFGDNWDLY